MIRIFLFLSALSMLVSCGDTSEERPAETQLLGTCEGCEAIFEYGDRILSSTDTLPDFHDAGEPILLTGTIYQADGRTPAQGVIMYIYHTNAEGIYPPEPEAEGWGKRHGSIRGWIRTGASGRYAFYTQKPAPYPNRTDPAHVHPIILEPDGRYYWVQDYYFVGDSLLTAEHADPKDPRGGISGVVVLREKNGILTGSRDIILGRNVPGYEKKKQ